MLSANHSDPVRQTSTHGASEQVAAKSNSAEGKTDSLFFCLVAFVHSLYSL